MFCKICQQKSLEIFSAKVLNKYDVKYFQCPNCEFIQTEEPYWLSEAYASPINLADTGIMKRNLYFSSATINIIYYYFKKNKTFLDYAGGYGIFVRIMRDIGIDFKWQDNFCQNLLARGFEYSEQDTKIELVTAFEVFEHLVNPITEIENILRMSKNILFSTELLPNKTPAVGDWWYYGLNHGQHISFYSEKTLSKIAERFKLNYYTNGSTLHMLTTRKINPFVFRVLVSRKKSVLAWIWARIHFKSKTQSDHLLMDNK